MSDDLNKGHIRALWRRQAVFLPVFFILLFAPAGTLDYWQAWVYAALFIVVTGAIGLFFYRLDPQVLLRRMRAGPAAETEPAQKIIMTLILIGFALLIAVPGLDRRWHWSDVPAWLVILADALVVLGFIGTAVVVHQNRYAASTIRVESGQPVVSTGLYAIVRHPMYAAALLLSVFTPLALGSYWSMLIIVPFVPALMWRLTDEERYLRAHLPGYAAYCARTRYRLVPGVW